jgi:hypothetical protein
VAAALLIGDGVAEFVVRKAEAARVQLMSVSDDVIEKARTLSPSLGSSFVVDSVFQATKIQAVLRGHMSRVLRQQVSPHPFSICVSAT